MRRLRTARRRAALTRRFADELDRVAVLVLIVL
jgi:hypothetical protein